MLIQNPKLAGEKLTLRYATNGDGDKLVVKGDHEGRFDVPERDAKFLLGTPGWKSVRAPAALDDEEGIPGPATGGAPASAPKPPLRPPAPASAGTAPRLAPKTPAPAPAAPSTPATEKGADDEIGDEEAAEQLAEEIAGLRTKADAMALAELHEVKGLSDDMKLSEMKELLERELLEAAEEPGKPAEG